MPLFCDVALAVPLDMVFTYAVPPGMEPVVGGRVLVPFRQQRLSGVVVELHDRPPQVKTKSIEGEQDQRCTCHHCTQVLLTLFECRGPLPRDTNFVAARSPPPYDDAE